MYIYFILSNLLCLSSFFFYFDFPVAVLFTNGGSLPPGPLSMPGLVQIRLIIQFSVELLFTKLFKILSSIDVLIFLAALRRSIRSNKLLRIHVLHRCFCFDCWGFCIHRRNSPSSDSEVPGFVNIRLFISLAIRIYRKGLYKTTRSNNKSINSK